MKKKEVNAVNGWKRKEFQNLAKRIKEENRQVTFRTIGESMYKGGHLL